MNDVHFPDWAERLEGAASPDGQKQSWAITVRWYLSFCRRGRGGEEIKAFLDHLAGDQRLSASSQRQALNAVFFLLREVFGKDLGDFSDYRRAPVRTHVPTWLTPAGAGTPWPQECGDDANLHARDAEAGTGGEKSIGCGGDGLRD